LKIKFSSTEFQDEYLDLINDFNGVPNFRLPVRSQDRNRMRNSQQYWKSLGLLDISSKHDGIIHLSDFVKKIADYEIATEEFASKDYSIFKID
jgi:hypothetical protein